MKSIILSFIILTQFYFNNAEDHVGSFVGLLDKIVQTKSVTAVSEFKSEFLSHCSKECLLYNHLTNDGSRYLNVEQYFNGLNIWIKKNQTNQIKTLETSSLKISSDKMSVTVKLFTKLNSIEKTIFLEFILLKKNEKSYEIISSSLANEMPTVFTQSEEDQNEINRENDTKVKPNAASKEDDIPNINENESPLKKRSKKTLVLTKEQKLIIEEIKLYADDVGEFHMNGLAIISIGGQLGVINSDGKSISKVIYDRINEDDLRTYSNKFRVTKNGLTGIMSVDGDFIVSPIYEAIDIVNNDYFITKSNKESNLFKFPNELIIKAQNKLEKKGNCIFADEVLYSIDGKKISDGIEDYRCRNKEVIERNEGIILKEFNSKFIIIDNSTCQILNSLDHGLSLPRYKHESHYVVNGAGLYSFDNKKLVTHVNYELGKVQFLARSEEIMTVDGEYFSLYNLKENEFLFDPGTYELVQRTMYVGQEFPDYILKMGKAYFTYSLENRELSKLGRVGNYVTTRSGYIVFEKKGKFGILDYSGNVIVPFKMDKIYANGGEIIIRPKESVNERFTIDYSTGKMIKNDW